MFRAVKEFGLSLNQLRELVLNGFRSSFMHTRHATSSDDCDTERDVYIDQVEKYYDAVVCAHLSDNATDTRP